MASQAMRMNPALGVSQRCVRAHGSSCFRAAGPAMPQLLPTRPAPGALGQRWKESGSSQAPTVVCNASASMAMPGDSADGASCAGSVCTCKAQQHIAGQGGTQWQPDASACLYLPSRLGAGILGGHGEHAQQLCRPCPAARVHPFLRPYLLSHLPHCSAICSSSLSSSHRGNQGRLLRQGPGHAVLHVLLCAGGAPLHHHGHHVTLCHGL